MDDDASNSYEFPAIVPLPFKILFLISLGSYLWFSIVKFNYKYFNINTLQLLSLSYSNLSYAQLDGLQEDNGEFATTVSADFKENQTLANGIWNTFYKVSCTAVGSFLAYHIFNMLELLKGGSIFSPIYASFPLIILIVILSTLFRPDETPGSIRNWTTLKRIITGAINSKTMRTNDILISDTLVSYSRVINDVVLYLWILFSLGPYSIYVETLALGSPVLIRVKQCWYEYNITGSRQHLLNMLKYLTTFGPLFINILVRITVNNAELNELRGTPEYDESVINRLASLNSWWYFLATINSTYSFIWDVKMDWGFGLFDFQALNNPNRGKTLVEQTLRPRSQLIGPMIKYYSIIAIDFVLRFLWILKFFQQAGVGESNEDYLVARVSGFLYGGNAYQLGYTILELLEIFRRWLWCFLKLEADWFKLQSLGIELVAVKEN